MTKEIQSQFLSGARLCEQMATDLSPTVAKAIDVVTNSLGKGNKILICGNGGSAADAQHFAAEWVNRYKIERPPLPALALNTDSSALTSIGNDSSFDEVFSKQILALGNEGDILFVLTTSDFSTELHGHSANIYRALLAAKEKKIKVIGLVSEKSQEILKHLDIAIRVPHKDTPRIQEAHMMILHIICELAEKNLETAYARS